VLLSLGGIAGQPWEAGVANRNDYKAEQDRNFHSSNGHIK
jgi:hypothetical protein